MNAVITIDKCGPILFKPCNDDVNRVTLTSVLYSANASANIIAIKPLIENGCKVVIEGKHLTILNKDSVVMQGIQNERRLYIVNSHTAHQVLDANCLNLTEMPKSDTLRILHNCLGHLHPVAIKKMIRNKMVTGIPENINFESVHLNCPHCVSGKLTSQPYPEKKYPTDTYNGDEARHVGDEVVSDSFGPIKCVSRYGNCHIVEFVDLASRFAFVFGIQTLDQIPAKYIIVRNLLSTQRGVKINQMAMEPIHPMR